MKKAKRKILTLLGCLMLIGCASESEEPEEAEFQPTPLVIETKKEDDITGLYDGIVSFSGEGTVEECYKGALRIDIVGRTAIVTMSDPVRSLFNKIY